MRTQVTLNPMHAHSGLKTFHKFYDSLNVDQTFGDKRVAIPVAIKKFNPLKMQCPKVKNSRQPRCYVSN